MQRTNHPSLDFPGHRRHPRVTTREGARALNRVTTPWWNARPPRGFGVLTTSGRKTEKELHSSVRAVRRGSSVYLVSIVGEEADWLRNVRANPNVKIRIKGGTFSGIAREITDTAERERAREAFCETIHLTDYIEGILHLRGLPTRARIQDMHRRWFREGIPLAIDLSPS